MPFSNNSESRRPSDAVSSDNNTKSLRSEGSTPGTGTPTMGKLGPSRSDQLHERKFPPNFSGLADSITATTLAGVKADSAKAMAVMEPDDIREQRSHGADYDSWTVVKNRKKVLVQRKWSHVHEQFQSQFSSQKVIANELDKMVVFPEASADANADIYTKLDDLKEYQAKLRKDLEISRLKALKQSDLDRYSRDAISRHDLREFVRLRDFDRINEKIRDLTAIVDHNYRDGCEAEKQSKNQMKALSAEISKVQEPLNDLIKSSNTLEEGSRTFRSDLQRNENAIQDLKAKVLTLTTAVNNSSLAARVDSSFEILQSLTGKIDVLETKAAKPVETPPIAQTQLLAEKVEKLEQNQVQIQGSVELLDKATNPLEQAALSAKDKNGLGFTPWEAVDVLRTESSKSYDIVAEDVQRVINGMRHLANAVQQLSTGPNTATSTTSPQASQSLGPTQGPAQLPNASDENSRKLDKMETDIEALQVAFADQKRYFAETSEPKLLKIADTVDLLDTYMNDLTQKYEKFPSEELCERIMIQIKKLYKEHPDNVLASLNDLRVKWQNMDKYVLTLEPRLHNVHTVLKAKTDKDALIPLSSRLSKVEADVKRTRSGIADIGREINQGVRAAREQISGLAAQPEGIQLREAINALGKTVKDQLDNAHTSARALLAQLTDVVTRLNDDENDLDVIARGIFLEANPAEQTILRDSMNRQRGIQAAQEVLDRISTESNGSHEQTDASGSTSQNYATATAGTQTLNTYDDASTSGNSRLKRRKVEGAE